MQVLNQYLDYSMIENNSLPLLTILIATRNRVTYAISAIESILANPETCFELVIQDNTDTQELNQYILSNVSDARLRYRYSPPPFSSMDNFNAGLELARGEYICMIGDDDGINPEIIDAVKWAKANDIDSLAVRQRVNYLWPSSGVPSTLFTKVTDGVLSIAEFSGAVEIVDTEREMKKLFANGGVYYLDYKLPKLYHGLVRRSCLETIKSRTGCYLGGLSPDIYSSLAIACVAKRVAVTDYPLTIPGACNASTSVSEGSIKSHSKKLEDAPHFRARSNYVWNNIVPRVYTVESIWVDSAIAALRDMGRLDLIEIFNLPKFSVFSIYANKGVVKEVVRHAYGMVKKNKSNYFWLTFKLLQYSLTELPRKFSSRALNRALITLGIRRIYRVYNVKNMNEVTSALIDFLEQNDQKFTDYLKVAYSKKPL